MGVCCKCAIQHFLTPSELVGRLLSFLGQSMPPTAAGTCCVKQWRDEGSVAEMGSGDRKGVTLGQGWEGPGVG